MVSAVQAPTLHCLNMLGWRRSCDSVSTVDHPQLCLVDLSPSVLNDMARPVDCTGQHVTTAGTQQESANTLQVRRRHRWTDHELKSHLLILSCAAVEFIRVIWVHISWLKTHQGPVLCLLPWLSFSGGHIIKNIFYYLRFCCEKPLAIRWRLLMAT